MKIEWGRILILSSLVGLGPLACTSDEPEELSEPIQTEELSELDGELPDATLGDADENDPILDDQEDPLADPNVGADVVDEFSDTKKQQEEASIQEPTFEMTEFEVRFGFDSAELDQEGMDALANIASLMEHDVQTRIVISGHTDPRGTKAYNMALGQRRSNVIKTYLLDLGVSAERMKALSFGESQPKVAGSDEESHRLNRRASFSIE